MPSKPPLERIATTSPDLSFGAMLSTISLRIGMQFGRRSRGVEGVDNVFGMQALGVRDALLLIDAGQNHVIGETETFNEIVFEHFAPQRVGARLQHGPEARHRDRRNAARAGFREWPLDDARNRR